jgi:hypothetical protein
VRRCWVATTTAKMGASVEREAEQQLLASYESAERAG